MDVDERDLGFTDGEIILTRESAIFMCLIANDDDDTCNYAMCEGCVAEHKSAGRRCGSDCREKRRKYCHHQIRNLQMVSCPYWCSKKYINGGKWQNKPKGCVCCNKKFVGNY